MAYLFEDPIFEERSAPMVSPTAAGRIPTLRTAHFIKPTSDSLTGPPLKLPSLSHSSESVWPLIVHFDGWHDPLGQWPIWVNSMLEKHKVMWEKSGIYEAIKCSTYKIRRNKELIFGLAERWCCETSSFLFPCAEASITLEDVMILGGFSVLGSPFSMPLETDELVIGKSLGESVKSIIKSKGRDGGKVSHSEWLEYFMGSGDDLEHEAFLTLWLSRCVLPGNEYNAINENYFPMAIHLARGIKIALAPVVLASLYRDLSRLKETIDKSFLENTSKKISVESALQYVQVWAWERLPALQPRPKKIQLGQPRLAQWRGVNLPIYENIRLIIDSAGDSFLWRPYVIAIANWVLPEYYIDKEKWVFSAGDFGEELESLARCLRVSELVGTDSIEAYLPHRVARQFGLDQDLPQWIPNSNSSRDIAWQNYTRPVGFWKMYVPSRLFEGDVTLRYLKWWDNSVLDLEGETKFLRKRKRSLRLGPPPGFPCSCYWRKDILETWGKNHFISSTEENNSKRKCVSRNEVEAGDCSEIEMLGVDVPERVEPEVADLNRIKFLRKRKRSLRLGPPPGFPRSCYWRKDILETWGKNHFISSTEENDSKRKCVSRNEVEAGDCNDIEMLDVDVPERVEPEVADLNRTKFLRKRKRSLRLGPPPAFPRSCYWRKDILETWGKNHFISSTEENDSKRKCVSRNEVEAGDCSEIEMLDVDVPERVEPEVAGLNSILEKMLVELKAAASSSRKIESEVVEIISVVENKLVELKARPRSRDGESSSRE